MRNNLDPISLKELNGHVKNEGINTFIFSSSFEKRCIQVAKNISDNGLTKVFLCRNEDAHLNAEETISEEAKRIFGKILEEVPLSKANPIDTVDGLIDALGNILQEKPRLLVDISCFTHENLLILRKVIKHMTIKASYVYCPANTYNPQANSQDSEWLSRGIGEVRSVLGYPGARDPLKSNHLIVLVGFEVERTRKLIDRYEPVHLSLGCADDETSEGAKDRNTKRFEELKSIYPEAESFEFSTRDIEKTKAAIKKQISEFDNANPIIAPMNTKISTLALAQAAEENKYIQICYASALVYNVEDYSEPSDECFLFDLP